jgi:hypothetical protein
MCVLTVWGMPNGFTTPFSVQLTDLWVSWRGALQHHSGDDVDDIDRCDHFCTICSV